MSIEYNTISNISELLNEYGREYQIIPNNEIFSREYSKHSKKCTFYTLRFGCSFAAVNTIKPQLL